MLKQSVPEEARDRPEALLDAAPLLPVAVAPAEAKRSPVELYSDGLIDELDRLYDAAPDSPHRAAFVGALTWKLAKIAFACGPFAAGDIVRRYGEHLASIALHDRAQREAEEEKAAGRAFQ